MLILFRATESRFRELWRMLARDLLDMHEEMPTIAGIDLNHAPLQDLLTDLLRPGGYDNAFGGTPTTSKGVQQDYILYDQRIEPVGDHCPPDEVGPLILPGQGDPAAA